MTTSNDLMKLVNKYGEACRSHQSRRGLGIRPNSYKQVTEARNAIVDALGELLNETAARAIRSQGGAA